MTRQVKRPYRALRARHFISSLVPITAVLGLSLLFISQANAQNLLVNSGFSETLKLGGWEVISDRAEWNERDIADSHRSGSAKGMHEFTGNSGAMLVLRQCLTTQVGGPYSFGAWTFAESGQGDGSFGGLTSVRMFTDSSDCSGTDEETVFSPTVTTLDEWVVSESVADVPQGVQSILFSLHIFKASGVAHDAVVFFDRTFLREQQPDSIYSDRFEQP